MKTKGSQQDIERHKVSAFHHYGPSVWVIPQLLISMTFTIMADSCSYHLPLVHVNMLMTFCFSVVSFMNDLLLYINAFPHLGPSVLFWYCLNIHSSHHYGLLTLQSPHAAYILMTFPIKGHRQIQLPLTA